MPLLHMRNFICRPPTRACHRSTIEIVGGMRKEAQRKLAITGWRQLFTLSENRIEAEDRYYRLLRSADDMEREGLITSNEVAQARSASRDVVF